MRVTLAAAAVSVLLVLLTWLSFRAIDTDAERYDRALKALDRFTMMETALQRDVLRSLDRLRHNASGDAEEAAAIDQFAAAATRQEELTEQLKSDNALLQNSLAYF